ncbi:MAG: hypothetical protein DUD35_05280 [Lactobacillus sp.]|jgi:hypothetical protein|nr:MAG: hypothetical protein DUD35_05280 [Lactobacillus sp.]
MNRTQKLFFENFRTYIRFQQRAMGEHPKSEWKGISDNFVLFMTPLIQLIGGGLLTPDLKESVSFAKLMNKDIRNIYYCETLHHVNLWRLDIDDDIDKIIKQLEKENKED